jgi:hypothetical protein
MTTQQPNHPPLMGRLYCSRKSSILVIPSLALFLALRLLLCGHWLSITSSGVGLLSKVSHPINNQNQQYHTVLYYQDSAHIGALTSSNAAVEVPSAFTIRPHLTFAWYRGGSILETFHSFVPLPNNVGYQVVYKVNTKDNTLPSGRAQSIETMQLSPTFERNEATRQILGASSFVNSGGNVQRQSGLSDPRAFFWNNSAYALTWRINRRDHDNFLYNLGTGEEFLLNDCIRG